MTDLITACAGAFVAFFAFVTIREGRKNRRKNSIEKQLEKLYNPLFEIMSEANPYETKAASGEVYRYVDLLKTDVPRIRKRILGYGHYLPPFEHGQLKLLFSFELSPSDRVLRFPYDYATARTHNLDSFFVFCWAFVRMRRHTLMMELYDLMSWKMKPADIDAIVGKDIGFKSSQA